MLEATLRTGTAGETEKRSLMKDRAYADIKRLILNGTVGPGEFLSERQLAARLQMSKTPIKSALERLEAEGFIGVSPQQGIVVHDLSLEEIADQFEIREILEPYVVRQLAGRLTPLQVERMSANLLEQEASIQGGDVQQNVRLDADFHLLWCEFLGNSEILATMQRLRDRIHRVVSRVSTRNPRRMSDGGDEHRQIAEAVLAGDGDLAAERMRHHLSYGKQFLLAPRRP
jgi:DNA-binding GntR family transcriptional regulator